MQGAELDSGDVVGVMDCLVLFLEEEVACACACVL